MNGIGYSWLSLGSQRFWSRSPISCGSPDFHPGFHSSVSRLISAVYERDSRWARSVIRNRIFTNEPLSESTWGMVRVAARRIDYSVDSVPEWGAADVEILPLDLSQDEACSESVLQCDLQREGQLSEDSVWKFLERLIEAARCSEASSLALPVSAALFDDSGTLLSWGVNSAWDFRTQHAEINLIRRWIQRGRGGNPSSLWVLRKSCKMCAGWIWDTWREEILKGMLRVHFRDPDNGRLARLTVLDSGSFEYQRALQETGKVSLCTFMS